MNDFISRLTKKKQFASLADASILSRVSEFVSTGIPTIDLVMGGGVPVGRMIEVYGDTSTGKSLLAAHILAETQHAGGIAVLMDPETATSVEIMESVGIDTETCIYTVPDTVEEVFKVIEDVLELKKEEAPDQLMTIVWDSVAATTSEDELARASKDGIGRGYPSHARLISQMCRILKAEIAKNRIAFVFINQTRQKLNIMFGDNTATFGGKAIPFYSSIRLVMKKGKKLVDGKDFPYGIMVKIGCVKNKVAPPFRDCQCPVIFGEGLDPAGAAFWWLRDKKLLVTKGSWYILEILGQELKFQAKNFEGIYYDYENYIVELLGDAL